MTPLLAQQLLDWGWVANHLDDVWRLTRQHVMLTALPMTFGVAIAFPLALVVQRWPGLYGPLLGFSGVLFTIPSLAVFVLMLPLTGLSLPTAVVPLTLYTLLVLLRNTVEGLRGVPAEVREAALAMGYTRGRLLREVELPLALPVIVAGLRITAVTTIGLVTITAPIGFGGYGQLFLDGFIRRFSTPLMLGLMLSVAFAVMVDVGLLGVQKALTPWTRSR